MINKIIKLVNWIKSAGLLTVDWIKENQNSIVLFCGVILISIISFGAGRITDNKSKNFESCKLNVIQEAVSTETASPINTPLATAIFSKNVILPLSTSLPTPTPSLNTQIVGNKNSKIYHYPWCSGAKNMLDKNKVFFNSISEAKFAGYRPASNCPGLN